MLEAERLARIDAAQRELRVAVADTTALANADARRRADRALAQLQQLAAGDTATLNAGRQLYATALVAAADPLIDSERFTLARQLLDAAAEQEPNSSSVAQASERLSAARATYYALREEQQRLVDLEAAQRELSASLVDTSALASADARRRADRALAQLRQLVEDDAPTFIAARQRYVTVYVAAANPLIDAKRFTLARQLLDAAAKQAPDSAAVNQAANRLRAAQSTYQTAREEQQRLARIEALQQKFSYEVNSGQLERAGATLGEYRSANPDTPFARSDGPAALADAYASRAEEQLANEAFGDARQSVAEGLGFVSDWERLRKLGAAVTQAELHHGIVQWFDGNSRRSVAALREDIQRYRATTADQFAADRRTWAQRVRARLQRLTSDPDAHNALLADALALLPGSKLLTDIQPLQAPPLLVLADILGQWCGDDVELEFAEKRMQFSLGPSYDVKSYAVGAELITVHWQNRNQEVIFEFGGFSPSKSEMVQLRGRQAQSNDWQTYNRAFTRCR
jgi:hypothetical protein